eukprot:5662681-Alexandrium_andersonii.AAC.1
MQAGTPCPHPLVSHSSEPSFLLCCRLLSNPERMPHRYRIAQPRRWLLRHRGPSVLWSCCYGNTAVCEAVTMIDMTWPGGLPSQPQQPPRAVRESRAP